MRPQVTSLFSRPNRRILLGGIAALGIAGYVAVIRPGFAQKAEPKGYEIMAADAAFEAAKTGDIILVDIRRPDEWQDTGIGEGAVALDMREESFVASLVSLRQSYPDTPIALICRTGNRSGYVVNALVEQGFPGLVDVSEGMVGGRNGQGWIPRNLPVYAGTTAEITLRLEAVMTP